jgi:CHAT domain-containing protein
MPALFAPQPYRGERAPCLELATHKWHRLAETAREVEETASLWRNEGPVRGAGASGVTFLTGARATEAAFKVEAQGRDVLHLATHAFFLSADCAMSKEDGSRPGASGASSSGARGMGGYVEVGTDPSPDGTSAVINPLQLSGIVLAGANQPARSAGADGEDGILTAEEIASLDLSSTQWAVLSACDTGLGEVRAGEGVLGLRRAFQTAGVRTVIVSLWSVEDSSTRSWMRELYRARFLDGLDTMTATRQAGLAVLSERRRSGQSAHPFFWGGFLAAGDWR